MLIFGEFRFRKRFNIHTTTRLNLFGERQYPVERSLESSGTTIAISEFFPVYFHRRKNLIVSEQRLHFIRCEFSEKLAKIEVNFAQFTIEASRLGPIHCRHLNVNEKYCWRVISSKGQRFKDDDGSSKYGDLCRLRLRAILR